MPFYEYECANCRFYCEVMQKISDAPLKKCPSCAKSSLKKLVSAPNFRLKGGGWYETDFKSDKENKRNLAVDKEPEAKAAPDAKPDTSPAETKPSEPKASESKASESKATEPAAKPAVRPKLKKKSKPKTKAVAKRRARR